MQKHFPTMKTQFLKSSNVNHISVENVIEFVQPAKQRIQRIINA